MKCLSIKQPFAELIVSSRKTIELRKQNTNFRGYFLVHASKRVDRDACNRLNIGPDTLITGAVIGKANLYAVKHYASKEEFLTDRCLHFATDRYYPEYDYGWLLNNALRLAKPVYLRGQLGFFNVEI